MIRAVDRNGIIRLVAGNGTSGYNCNNCPATSSMISNVWGLVVDDSRLVISDYTNCCIRQIFMGNRSIVTIAGICGQCNHYQDIVTFPEGAQGTAVRIGLALSLATDMDAGFFVVDTSSYCVLRLSRDAAVTTAAGNCTAGALLYRVGYLTGVYPVQDAQASIGDGGPAVNATFSSYPYGVTSDGAHGFYVTESQTVRRVFSDGLIVRVAGNGSKGSDGDGGPALNATLQTLRSISFDTGAALAGRGDGFFIVSIS